jgi:hypothetical protein
VFILNIILLPFKPLRTHGFLPLISSFSLFFRLALKSFVFSSFEFQGTIFAELFDHIGEASAFCFYFIYPITLIRFIILIDLSRQRINIVDKKNKIKFKFKCLKAFNHPFTIPILTFPLYMFLVIITAIFLSLPEESQDFLGLTYTFGLIFGVFVYFSCMMADLISTLWKINFDLKKKNLKCSWKLPLDILKQLSKEDRFYFRFQFYFLIPISFFSFFFSTQFVTGDSSINILKLKISL